MLKLCALLLLKRMLRMSWKGLPPRESTLPFDLRDDVEVVLPPKSTFEERMVLKAAFDERRV